ncbi:MAG: ribosome-associated translation inhibitor RaiA [Marivirga sp.]|jgi:ribosome-associated translation inhibitor RaiA
MKIQFNTDKNINGDERNENHFTSIIADSLERYDSHITRIEVHLSDENGQKEGQDDILCTLEARLEGKQPTVVSCHANSIESALSGALDKLKAALKTILGRMQNH